MEETVIRVRWATHKTGNHCITFADDDHGLEEAGKFSDYLLQQGAMQVRMARERKSWA